LSKTFTNDHVVGEKMANSRNRQCYLIKAQLRFRTYSFSSIIQSRRIVTFNQLAKKDRQICY